MILLQLLNYPSICESTISSALFDCHLQARLTEETKLCKGTVMRTKPFFKIKEMEFNFFYFVMTGILSERTEDVSLPQMISNPFLIH